MHLLGCYPCLLCTIHKDDMKIPLSRRGYSPTRTLEFIYENHSKYSAAGYPRRHAQFYSNCISEPIWDIPLDQVSNIETPHMQVYIINYLSLGMLTRSAYYTGNVFQAF